jgi:hypothetical protein
MSIRNENDFTSKVSIIESQRSKMGRALDFFKDEIKDS